MIFTLAELYVEHQAAKQMELLNKYFLACAVERAVENFEDLKVTALELLEMNQEQLQEWYLKYQELISGGDGVIEEPLD